MRAVIQRVTSAEVKVDGEIKGSINGGFLILLGIGHNDLETDIDWLIKKIIGMRVFNDSDNKMNLSIMDTEGQFLVVSQFTLMASTKKGNRPSYMNAARPDVAIPMYEQFCKNLSLASQKTVAQGVFGADMKVSLLNDGPVTIILDSKSKE